MPALKARDTIIRPSLTQPSVHGRSAHSGGMSPFPPTKDSMKKHLHTLLLCSLLSGCGGGGGDEAVTPAPVPAPSPSPVPVPLPPADLAPPPVADYAQHAQQLSAAIVGATDVASAVEATRQALASGGVRVAGGANGAGSALAARLPAATWSLDPALVFNLASEARDRAQAGRITLADLGRMWADFGFPFANSAGAAQPGEQLLNLLRQALLDARALPGQAGGFTPLLLAAMAQQQSPAFDLAQATSQAADLRLTLLELELLSALFDRLFQPQATAKSSSAEPGRARPLAASDGLCGDLKNTLGPLGAKAFDAGLQYGAGMVSEAALKGIGMTAAEIPQFATYGKVLGALGPALAVLKLAQTYAAGQATLTIEGPNPIRKPPWQGARVLVPVTARVGVPDQAWADYQRSNGSDAYQSVKSCLDSLGAPLPLDLKDIAGKMGDWRVNWDLSSGSPRHAWLKTDVNNFNAASNGAPFGMKFSSAGAAAAEAKLKVDIREETQLATLFQGPLLTAKVKVKASVITSEPPSPAVLASVLSLSGTLGALVDLSVGWVQAMLPPTTTHVISVQYHDEPNRIDASLRLSMNFDAPRFRDSDDPPFVHSLVGEWSGPLQRRIKTQGDTDYAYFDGVGNFRYAAVATANRFSAESGSRCTSSFAYNWSDGSFQVNLGPAVNLAGTVLPEEPEQLGLGGGPISPAQWPQEQKTQTETCVDSAGQTDIQVLTFPAQPEIFVAAANAMNLQDALLFSAGSAPPGMHLRNGRLLADGTLELAFTAPKTVSVIAGPGVVADTRINSQNSLIRLKPSYPAGGP